MNLMALKQDGVHSVLCPKQSDKIESAILHRVCILEFFCPKEGQGFKPSKAHLYPSIGQVYPCAQRVPGCESSPLAHTLGPFQKAVPPQ